MRLQSEIEDTCTTCPYAAACLGDNMCAEGYSGHWCAACEPGYFAFKSRCRSCPNDSFWILYTVLLCLLFFGFAVGMLHISTHGHALSTGAVSIMFTHTQLTARMLTMDVGWPPFFRLAMEWISDLFGASHSSTL